MTATLTIVRTDQQHHATIPAAVLDHLADLDTDHERTCDLYDIATRELDAARDALTEAARRLTDAEDAWAAAGAEMNDAAVACSRARQAAGLTLTADGYRPVAP